MYDTFEYLEIKLDYDFDQAYSMHWHGIPTTSYQASNDKQSTPKPASDS